jgi:hypothetical protein
MASIPAITKHITANIKVILLVLIFQFVRIYVVNYIVLVFYTLFV